MAVRLSGNVASSSKQSESLEQPHRWESSEPPDSLPPDSDPLPPDPDPDPSEAAAPQTGRSIGQLESDEQPAQDGEGDGSLHSRKNIFEKGLLPSIRS